MSYAEYKYDPYVQAYNRLADGGEITSGGFDPRNNPDDRKKLILVVLGALAFTLLFVVFSGCTRRVYVPVERTTTVYETVRDTVVEIALKETRDTVNIETKGRDTLSYLSNGIAYSFASIENGVLGHSLGTVPGATVKDSVKVIHTHTIDSIPYPVKVEVEKKLTWWQKIKLEYGGFAMGLATALAFIFALFLWKEKKERD